MQVLFPIFLILHYFSVFRTSRSSSLLVLLYTSYALPIRFPALFCCSPYTCRRSSVYSLYTFRHSSVHSLYTFRHSSVHSLYTFRHSTVYFPYRSHKSSGGEGVSFPSMESCILCQVTHANPVPCLDSILLLRRYSRGVIPITSRKALANLLPLSYPYCPATSSTVLSVVKSVSAAACIF